MQIVDHDALWRVSLNEVWRRGALAPNCSVIKFDEHMERKLVSCNHTAHVCDRVESGRLFVEMLLMAAATAERDFVRDVNKKRCHITLHFDTEHTSTAESSDNDKTNAFPDGNINTERGSFRQPEAHCTFMSGMRVGGFLIEVTLMKEGKTECAIFFKRTCSRSRCAKERALRIPSGLGLCSAAVHDVPYADFS